MQFKKHFNFRGGEFGNYESASDRVTNIERSYDAFCALAETLNISVKDYLLMDVSLLHMGHVVEVEKMPH